MSEGNMYLNIFICPECGFETTFENTHEEKLCPNCELEMFEG